MGPNDLEIPHGKFPWKSSMVSHGDFPSSQDFAGESLEKVLGSDLRRAPLHWVLPMEILGDTTGFPSMGVPWGTRNGWFIRENPWK